MSLPPHLCLSSSAKRMTLKSSWPTARSAQRKGQARQ
jgi:hypothetical protein